MNCILDNQCSGPYHFDSDPDPTYLVSLWCGSGSWFLFDADPDPEFYGCGCGFGSYFSPPGSGSSFQLKAQTLEKLSNMLIVHGLSSANWCGSGSKSSLLLWCGSGSWILFDADPDPDFYLTRMRIRVPKMNPDPCGSGSGSTTLLITQAEVGFIWVAVPRLATQYYCGPVDPLPVILRLLIF